MVAGGCLPIPRLANACKASGRLELLEKNVRGGSETCGFGRLFRIVLFSFYNGGMERFAPKPADLAEAILEAPGWARLGIAVQDERLRSRAAHELALSIVEHLNPAPADAANQLPLAL